MVRMKFVAGSVMSLSRSKFVVLVRNRRRTRGPNRIFRKGHLKPFRLLKMLAVMEASSQGASPSSGGPPSHDEPPIQEFLSSGRTGRRNALPDILGQHAVVTSSDLPAKLQALSTKDQASPSPATPNDAQPGPSSAQS